MVSISSTEVFLSVMVPVSGRLQGWFQLPGLPGYLLALFFTFAPPPRLPFRHQFPSSSTGNEFKSCKIPVLVICGALRNYTGRDSLLLTNVNLNLPPAIKNLGIRSTFQSLGLPYLFSSSSVFPNNVKN